MSNRSASQKGARRLQKLYNAKAHGTTYQTILRLVQTRGVDGAAVQLEAWGMRAGPITPEGAQLPPEADDPNAYLDDEPSGGPQ